jgi:hypothetical protein
MLFAGISITHKFCTDGGAPFDIDHARQPSPYNHIAWRRVAGAGKIAAESGNLGQVM